jgi:hypothetical protein
MSFRTDARRILKAASDAQEKRWAQRREFWGLVMNEASRIEIDAPEQMRPWNGGDWKENCVPDPVTERREWLISRAAEAIIQLELLAKVKS